MFDRYTVDYQNQSENHIEELDVDEIYVERSYRIHAHVGVGLVFLVVVFENFFEVTQAIPTVKS